MGDGLMPVFRLTSELLFPHPSLANEDGILAVGGDLSPERLLLAYANGIFPWFSEGDPIIWWSPNPRCVLYPDKIIISRSMRKFLKKNLYKVTFDKCFKDVITKCSELRKDNTWITQDIIESYSLLHQLGFAHSVETWYEGNLVGGLYGVSLGKCFFGESMFSVMDNASKTALITLSQRLLEMDFLLIDCQVHSKHLESLGAINIDRNAFFECLKKGLSFETMRGSWQFLNE